MNVYRTFVALCVAIVSIDAVACSREPGAAENSAGAGATTPAWTLRMTERASSG